MRVFISHARRSRHCLAALLFVVLPASARVLPNVDAHADAPVAVSAARAKIQQRAETIATAHIEERLGVPTFLALRPGRALLASDATKKMSAETAARAHLKGFADLYRISAAEIDAAPLHHIEHVFNGAILARFTNQKDGIEIFRESVTLLMKSPAEASAISGSLGATANVRIISAHPAAPYRLTSAEAVAAALGDYNFDASIAPHLVRANVLPATENPRAAAYQHFLLGVDSPVNTAASMSEPARTKPVWFRIAEGLVPAHYVELQMADAHSGSLDYYSYVIAADDGRILFRNNQTADASFTYKVWADATGINLPQTGPQGRNGTPHPTGLDDGYQPPFVPQSLVTLQNGPISTADPWLLPGATRTIGNNVEAWANHVAPPSPGSDGFDADPAECNMSAPFIADFHACISSTATFAYSFDPNAAPKSSKPQAAAAVVNLFYVTNWLHDWYYDAGFREIDGNAQSNNFGRGGAGGDSMKAQAQDNAGINNANMSVPADGGRPRMRMYLFTGNEAAAVTVTPPGSNLPAGTAAFGPAAFDVPATLVLVNDGSGTATDGCQAIVNNVSGQIALIDRGICTFKTKLLNAQNAGAIGVIVANNVSGGVVTMADDTSIVTPITVPGLMVSIEDGTSIKNSLLAGAVTARIRRFFGVDRDGALDNSIIAHEWGHFISNRLIGDANGLATVQARGLGEGWSDFHALLMMARAEDALVAGNANFTGVYAIGGYVEDEPLIPGATQSSAHYTGLRRYPYSSDMSRNPLTFKHIQTSQSLPANPPPGFSGDNAETHATGEIWASMLWSCYSSLLRDTARLTFDQAQDRMKRYLVASYKLTPVNPTLVEARDALFAAIAANDPLDLTLCMAAFAQRGAGAGAASGDRFAEDNSGVTESFATGGDLAITGLTFSAQASVGCDADAFLDLGESGIVGITVKNTGNTTLSGATVNLSGIGLAFPDGASLTLPALAPFASATVTRTIRLAQQETIGVRTVVATVDHPSLAIPGGRTAALQIFTARDGVPGVSTQDDVEASASLWTPSLQGTANAALNWTRVPVTSTNRVWRGPTGDSAGVAWLTSPTIQLVAGGSIGISFSHRYAFESRGPIYADGGVIEISIDGGATWTDIGAGSGLYLGSIANIAGTANPLAGRPAVVGTSVNYPNFALAGVTLPSSYLGRAIRLRFGVGTDIDGAFTGWDLDNIAIIGAAMPPFAGYVADALSCISLLPSAGNPQAALVGTTFSSPLQIRVMGGDGRPISGAVVNFVAPASGASATFIGGTGNSVSATTDSNGFASTPQLQANNISGNYSVTANVATRTTSFMLTNFQADGFIAVVSRKTHGATGAFDVVIDTAQAIADSVTVEPRGIGSGHRILFQFNTAITDAGAVAVTDGANLPVSASATFFGNDVVVTIPTLADNKRVKLTLTGVNGSVSRPPVSMGFLIGDVNNTRSVNSSDISGVKARSGQTSNATNFRFDVNATGAITSTDISAVKARSGLVLPQ